MYESSGLHRNLSGLRAEPAPPLSRGSAGLVPHRAVLRIQHGQLWALLSASHSEQPAGHDPVLLGHDVIENGVDGGAEIEQNEGDEVAVLADLCN